MSYIERCKCGHDISSHFRDSTTRKLHGCLANMCDCPVYWDRDAKPPVVPTKVEVDECPDTDRLPVTYDATGLQAWMPKASNIVFGLDRSAPCHRFSDEYKAPDPDDDTEQWAFLTSVWFR